jgi:2-polyprenyl-6-methoxyphenol hydroxylase-like FAD-dependent oxidoreductase
MPSSSRRRHDVVVVGARAAGSATALLLARMGHDVAVLERAQFPSDTLSTHSVWRSGVVQLSRWGLLDRVLASGTPAIRQPSSPTAWRSALIRLVSADSLTKRSPTPCQGSLPW